MVFNTLVDASTLTVHLEDPKWIVFDCRFSLMAPDQGRSEYEQGHIPGARYADLDRNLASPKGSNTGRHPLPEADAFVDWLRNNGVNEDSQVVVYDANAGMFASRLWWMMRWLGHERVALLDGGWAAWADTGMVTATDIPVPEKGNFNGQADDAMWVTTQEIEELVVDRQSWCTIVDARAKPRFDGDKEPIDPVAGHIPGAVNSPCTSNVDGRGYFLPAEQLHERFQTLMTERDPVDVINMCGSGVTACRNILAMEIAGWPGTRLYPGSWSEWITDPQRPIATSE